MIIILRFLLAVEPSSEFIREALSDLVRQSAMSNGSRSPEVSLREGRWVKLICGASFEVSDLGILLIKLDCDGIISF